jgi:hemolysin activation/secretion protein
LGAFALDSSLALNSVFGFGEQIYGSASSGYNLGRAFTGASPLEVFGGGFSLPIGADGLIINPEYVNSITRPAAAAGSPPSVGYFERSDLRASYPVIRTRAQTLTLQGTWEWDEEHLVPTGFDTDLYKDKGKPWGTAL